jgi:hypothetical protein
MPGFWAQASLSIHTTYFIFPSLNSQDSGKLSTVDPLVIHGKLGKGKKTNKLLSAFLWSIHWEHCSF